MQLVNMKVAYFLGGLNRGGAETLILDICRKHADVPFDFVCMYRHEGNMSAEFISSGASMIHVPKRGRLLRYILDIRKIIKREHITIVHSQTPSNTLLLAFALMGTDVKIITSIHGHSFADAPWWQRKIVYAASKRIICVSNYQKQYFEKKWHLLSDNKIQVVYNGIDFSKLAVTYPKPEFMREKDRPCLAMVGSFNSGRSQIVVCKALKMLNSRGMNNFEFFFIGAQFKGEEYLYEECVTYCKDNNLHEMVHFLGQRSDVPAIIQNLDGFIYSTVSDTFGIAVVEAMACGIPVIVNDWAVMEEITDGGNWATMYPSDNVDQLAQTIEELLLHLDMRKNEAIHRRTEVMQRFSIQAHINKMAELYKD